MSSMSSPPASAFSGLRVAAFESRMAGPMADLIARVDLQVPEPNPTREILAPLDAHLPVAGLRVAVQEYGAPNPELIEELERRGATVMRVPVYHWALPEDTGPLREAIAELIA